MTCFKRFCLFSAALMPLMVAVPLLADDTDQGIPERTVTLPERITFCAKFYGLSDSEQEQLREKLETKVLAHRQYMKDKRLDLRRRSAAISVALPQQKDEDLGLGGRKRLHMQYQEEIYQIHEAAPMSLAFAAKSAEEIVGNDRAKQGREKIASFFGKVLEGQPVDVAKMDRLVLSPVKVHDVAINEPLTSAQAKLIGDESIAPTRPTPEERRQQAAAAKAKALEMQKQQQQKLEAERQSPPPEVPDSLRTQKLETAPAVSEWEVQYQTWANEYGFSAEQKTAAESVYNYSHRKALEFMSENKQKIETARGGNDEGALKEIMAPVNNIYNQMKQRIDAIASMEQRANLAKKRSGNESSDADKTDGES